MPAYGPESLSNQIGVSIARFGGFVRMSVTMQTRNPEARAEARRTPMPTVAMASKS